MKDVSQKRRWDGLEEIPKYNVEARIKKKECVRCRKNAIESRKLSYTHGRCFMDSDYGSGY